MGLQGNAALVGKFYRVADQVHDDLADSAGVRAVKLVELIIKLFEIDEDATIYLLLDTSHSMRSEAKFRQARQLAAALGYIALNNAFDDPARGAKASSILVFVGFVNVPIIKFSVDWWNSLHQPASVFRADGPAIHSSILWPLLIMATAYTVLFLTLHLVAMRSEILGRRIRQLQLARLEG